MNRIQAFVNLLQTPDSVEAPVKVKGKNTVLPAGCVVEAPYKANIGNLSQIQPMIFQHKETELSERLDCTDSIIMMKKGVNKRKTERQREIERDRETERKTERETERDRERQRDRKRQRETERDDDLGENRTYPIKINLKDSNPVQLNDSSVPQNVCNELKMYIKYLLNKK